MIHVRPEQAAEGTASSDTAVGSSPKLRLRRLLVLAVCFGLPALLSANYHLNYFYGHGAAALDAGWFAALASGPVSLVMPNPPCIGGSFYAYHVSPIFVVEAVVHRVLKFLPTPVFFSLTQALWFGILGLAMGWCTSAILPQRPGLAALLGLLTACNGVAVATLGFPHFELAIPALLCLTAAWRLAPPSAACRAWLAPMLLLLTVREDAGLQCATLFGCIGLWRVCRREGGLADLGLAMGCALLSVSEILLRRHFYPTGADLFRLVYIGNPAFAHVTWGFLSQRFNQITTYRSYIWAPLLLMLGLAAITCDLRPALGALASLPWFLLLYFAVSPEAGGMTNYYAFPMIVGLVWPLYAALPALRASFTAGRRYLWLQGGAAAMSLGLFVQLPRLDHDPHPWSSFTFDWTSRVGRTEGLLNRMLNARVTLGPLVVDDAVAALRMNEFAIGEWRFLMRFTPAELQHARLMIYQPDGWTDPGMRKMEVPAGLAYKIHPKGTSFEARSRLPLPTGLAEPVGHAG